MFSDTTQSALGFVLSLGSDTFILVTIVLVAAAFVFMKGKGEGIALSLSFIVGYAVLQAFPFLGILKVAQDGTGKALTGAAIAFGVAGVMYYAIGHRVAGFFRDSRIGKTVDAFLLASAISGIFLSIAYLTGTGSMLYDFSAPIETLFEPQASLFWWLTFFLIYVIAL